MKKAFSAVAQFVMFYVVFLVGSLLDPFHMKWFVHQLSLTATRYFVPDGLILAAVLYLVVLGIEAARKRPPIAAILTTVAFLLAILLGILSKFGRITHDLLG